MKKRDPKIDIMGFFKKLKPAFWDSRQTHQYHPHEPLDFQLKWKMIVGFTTLMALLPLVVFTIIEYRLNQQIMEAEIQNTLTGTLKPVAQCVSHGFGRLAKTDRHPAAFNDETLKLHMNATLQEIQKSMPGVFDDIFIVNQDGTLVTPSGFYGSTGDKTPFRKSNIKGSNALLDDIGPKGTNLLIGYTDIPDSSLILVMIKNKDRFTDLWTKPRFKLLGYLVVSILVILISIMGMATYLVGRIHAADQKRVRSLHQSGYANKLASIGRLASGMAHEINNPLAIINQKTGLMLDLMDIKKAPPSDGRLTALATDILKAVERCGTITQRLLDFTQSMDSSREYVDMRHIVTQVLTFFRQQAREQGITISFDKTGEDRLFFCDKGGLQQVMLNVINNAFAAMDNGGSLNITLKFQEKKGATIIVSDTGCGIPHQDIHNIFEPFFTVKDNPSGTGLGLYVTYGIIKEMGGEIFVESMPKKGTTFTIKLPDKQSDAPLGYTDVEDI